MTTHVSSFDEDEDHWVTVGCSCRFTFGPVPDWETAADVWGDHKADTAQAEVDRLTAELDALRGFMRKQRGADDG